MQFAGGIPTVKDRVVQRVALLVLAPIFEADFHPHSYGFRPQRRAHQALDAIIQALRQGKLEVVDADLSKYFDTIPHGRLMMLAARRLSDGSMWHLLRQWLDAPIVEEGDNGKRRELPNRQGVPQGGVISPLLANLYLNALDWALNDPQEPGRPVLVRYADDGVILCAPGQGTELVRRLRRWLAARGLKLNEEKTHLVPSREGFNFRARNKRHRFSIRTLVHWYRTGQDVEAHLPELATYLGHGHVNDTYWYLSATPELLQLATRRWQRQEGGRRS